MPGSMGPTYVLDKSVKAGGAIGQYLAVKFSDEATVVVCDTQGERAIGICQVEVIADDATAGRDVNVRVLGISYAISGQDTLVHGTPVTVGDDGKIETAASGDVPIGICLQDADTDEPTAVLLTPGMPAIV